MKYTRYDLKAKKNNSITVIIIIVLLFFLAYLIGTIFFDAFIKNKKDLDKTNVSKAESKFVFIQCGLYENKDNAVKLCSSLSDYGNSFIVEEENKSRVLLGIYSEKEAKELSDKLLKKGIDNVKITYVIKQNDLCNKEIIEIINADIKVLTKLSEKDVRAIQTAELKKWISNLEDVNNKGKNFKQLEELKKYNNNLPKEIDRSKASEIYIYIYKFLNKLQK